MQLSDDKLVLALYGDILGYVCGDHWTDIEADIVCKELGYKSKCLI